MIPDTNVLVRLSVEDHSGQTEQARKAMREADAIHLSNTMLCEFVWAVRQIYRYSRHDIMETIRLLVSDERIVCDRGAVDAGLEFMGAGGDFADGVIAFEGRRIGGRCFVTFDRRAAAIVTKQGHTCLLLGSEPPSV